MNRAQRQEKIINSLTPSPQPKRSSSRGIELIQEGLQILLENDDLIALSQVVGNANFFIQEIVKRAARRAKG